MFGLGNKTEYQLVIEFADDSPENIKRVTDVEMQLDDELKHGEVDGHDVGQGIVNLFIITKLPDKCFAEAMSHMKSSSLTPGAAAYRLVAGGEYVRLWPIGDKTPFELK
jgi:hypothetical protein